MKNRILISITIAAALVFILTACTIDTNSLAITVPCFASLGWLGAFVYANCHRSGE